MAGTQRHPQGIFPEANFRRAGSGDCDRGKYE